MNIVFTMGGADMRSADNYPIYLSEIGGETIIERQIALLGPLNANMIFCVATRDIKEFNVDSILRQIVPDCKIISVSGSTSGAVCTALLAGEFIDNSDELVVMSVTDFIESGACEAVDAFRKDGFDSGVVSFTSIHPRYSYAKQDSSGEVIEFAEKHPISKNALVSFYYFRNGSDFCECARRTVRKGVRVNDAFYLSQTLNEMILMRKRIGIFKIANEAFHPLKTEMQVMQYLERLSELKNSK